MIILDLGSGNTVKSDINLIKRTIDELAKVDKDRKCILKWQLFKKAGFNEVLTNEAFDFAYNYAAKLGFQTTASVFDQESLEFLMKYKVPFIKIANVSGPYEWFKPLANLATKVPAAIPLFVSYTNFDDLPSMCEHDRALFCVSEYPADIKKYKGAGKYISDHTTDWTLYKKLKPKIYECHFAIEGMTGADVESGVCRTPKMLKEIL